MENSRPEITALLRSVAVHGDEASYRQLFDIFFPSLHRFALYFLRSRRLAEEAASDSMIALWEHRDQLSDMKNPRVWLFVITRNKCLNILRHQQNPSAVPLDFVPVEIGFPEQDPEQICLSTEMRKKMARAVNSLPQRCKIIFKLVKEEDLNYKEVADILNISSKTVDAQLVAAFRKITQSIRLDYAY
jgi:RNA polymerase sigma-70 factor (ECF subfamily)